MGLRFTNRKLPSIHSESVSRSRSKVKNTGLLGKRSKKFLLYDATSIDFEIKLLRPKADIIDGVWDDEYS